MPQPLSWERDRVRWPHHAHSRFVDAGGLRWHVQQMGQGPVVLLLHGTGASTHSWRGLLPLLAPRFTVVAMDLPGHAFTGTPPARALTLAGMARALHALVAALGVDVAAIVGHSAGAAIGLRMALDGLAAPRRLVAVNGALLPFGGLPGLLFPPVARLMAATPFAAQLFARRHWDRAAVEQLIGGTGSTLDGDGLALYGALVQDPRHVAGALGMMARWNLHGLARDLPRLRVPVTLIVGNQDRAVPPSDAAQVCRRLSPLPGCRIERLDGGHLVHEERPAAVAAVLQAELAPLACAG